MGYQFKIDKVGNIKIKQLSYSYAYEHSDELLKIINIIPYIEWTRNNLLSQTEDYFGDKWNYSYVIENSEDKIIGLIIAYFRLSDNRHIFDSLYIHKFAIIPEYQNMGIGTNVLQYFIQRAFYKVAWLFNISVQTNNDSKNMHVIQFYRNNGFRDMYNIFYSNKTDILLLIERMDYKAIHVIDRKFLEGKNFNLKHPRLNYINDIFGSPNCIPVVYFSSTNERKKEIVKFIFHNYNIEVNFVKASISLIEPQVEKPELEEERKLVELPLKQVSRFVTVDPYTVEDTMLFIEFFNRNGGQWELPGLDTKRWLRQLGLDGLLDIMGSTKKRKAKFVSQTGAYIRPNEYYYGRSETQGTIAFEKASISNYKYGTYPYFFHLIFIPEGADKTLAEMNMHEYAQYDYMRKSIVDLIGKLASSYQFYSEYTIFDYLQGRIDI